MIKLFEEYNEYYQEISEFHSDSIPFDLIPFDLKELKNIKTYIDNLYSNKLSISTSTLNRNYRLSDNDISDNDIYVLIFYFSKLHIYGEYSFGDDEEVNICLQKLPDEWYIVGYDDLIWYKCDQLEGVYKLLKDKLKI